MSLKVITPPTDEPLTLDEVKLHLHEDGDAQDSLISAIIRSTRERAEHLTGRALLPQKLELALNTLPGAIKLPRPSLISVTSVTYLDAGGVLQTLPADQYVVDSHQEPARVVIPGPTIQVAAAPNAVRIVYQAGYASADVVPGGIKTWMLLRIAELYAQREGVVFGDRITAVPQVDRWLDPYRFWEV